MTCRWPGARVDRWLVATLESPVSVRADWGLQALDLGDSEKVDPFDAASSAWMTNDAAPDWGFAISIETPSEELRRLLGIVVSSEMRMGAKGLTCAIKDSPETTCLACPLSRANDDSSPKRHLCRAGREQERLSTLLLAQRAKNGS